jgi:iron(III) transport system substrate-binding protein
MSIGHQLAVVVLLFVSTYTDVFAAEVNIYSARKEKLIKPLLERFEQETGIQVNLVTGKGDALLTRLVNEGDKSPADLLITTDAGRLHRAREAGVLQSVNLGDDIALVPEAYRDPDNRWFGLSRRARVIVYSLDRVQPEQLSTYESLAEDKWKGRVCIRSSSNIYNQSLVASRIALWGMERTENWLAGLVSNLARPPQGGDRDQVKAVVAGQCDVAVINSYYLGAMLKDDEQRPIAEQVGLFWPDQQADGTHVNISGAGVTTSAPNRDAAIQLLKFLLTDESQSWYAEVNNEYPVRQGIDVSELLQGWGEFHGDELPVSRLGELNAEAVMAMDRAGWK